MTARFIPGPALPMLDDSFRDGHLRPEFKRPGFDNEWLRQHGCLDALQWLPAGGCLRQEGERAAFSAMILWRRA